MIFHEVKAVYDRQTGEERARIDGKKCARVIACVNHDPNAIKSHAANPEDLFADGTNDLPF